jgi:signal peptidase II
MGIFYISLIIVLVDQATKVFVKGCSLPFFGIEWKGFPLYTSVPLLGDFLRFTYIENAGMAFGIDVGGKLYFSLFSVVASIVIAVYLYKISKERFSIKFPVALIFGGATGNLIDRVFYGVFYNEGDLFYGKVVDFIDVEFFDIHLFNYSLTRWPVFNIADASVTVGILFLLFAHRSATQQRIASGSSKENNAVNTDSVETSALPLVSPATQQTTEHISHS